VSRVLILTFTEVVNDPRVMRHVAALRNHYDVVTCGQGPAPQGVVQHIELPPADHLPRTSAGVINLALRRTRKAYTHVPAAAAARRALASTRFDLAIANDINAVSVAYELAAGRPVMADLHEYAPRQFEGDWRWRLMIQPFNVGLCREYLPKVAAVSTVGDGIAEQYRRDFGVRCVTITNAGEFRAPRPRPVGPLIRAVHTGAAQPNRELELMIRASADVPGMTLDIFLVAGARNRSYLRSLRDLAAATGNVRVLDPVAMVDVPATLDDYDLGVFVLPPNSFNALHTLPNKFFDFVQSGLGVVVGPSPEMAVLVERHKLGLVLPDFTEAGLREALASLDPAAVAAWKSAACQAADVLSAQPQAESLRKCVADLLAP